MQCRLLGKFVCLLCLVATGALFLRGCSKYLQDKSSTVIQYRTFQDTEKDIYPTITLCFWNDVFRRKVGIYDLTKLNDTYNITNPWEYINFLGGEIWKDEMVGVNYDDVTLDIQHRVESVNVVGNRVQVLYNWVADNKNTNETARSFPFYTSYRYAHAKCFSLDLSAEVMPNIRGRLINLVAIKFKDIRIPNVNLQYMFSYPGQILQGLSIDLEFAWSQRLSLIHI